MILGVDTDVLVHWQMNGAPRHRDARQLIDREMQSGAVLGLTPQVLAEFIHIVTDGRRFEQPMTMPQATDAARRLWLAPEVEHVFARPALIERALELCDRLRLGRKRILDTWLACTFEAAQVERIATFNGKDFQMFAFLTVVAG